MITAELLSLLCCPETHQDLRLADAALLESLNRRIASGTLKNRAGRTVESRLEGGLVRADGKWLYPITGQIPVLLIDEALDLRCEE